MASGGLVGAMLGLVARDALPASSNCLHDWWNSNNHLGIYCSRYH